MSIEAILSLSGWGLYSVLFFALMGGAVGLPIPEDLPLIAAGILAERGNAPIPMLFAVCYIAVVLGDTIIFFIGRSFGSALFKKEWFQKRFTPRKLKLFQLRLEKRSVVTIFIARHLFYFRMVTFLTCGAVKMRFSRFIAADAFAALVSVPLMMAVGYFASENYEHLVNNLEYIFIAIAAACIGYFLIKRKKKVLKPST